MKVVNLFGGPGAGKSTTAAGLFYLMKTAGLNVELVTEYAKDLTWEESWRTMGNQLTLLGEQDRRLQRLDGKVDYAITDSPILQGLAYARGRYREAWFRQAVEGAFKSYDNVNFFIAAAKPYSPHGRRQSEKSARALDEVITQLLLDHPTYTVKGDETAPALIRDILLLNQRKDAHAPAST